MALVAAGVWILATGGLDMTEGDIGRSERAWVIAHRGFSGRHPENTVTAVDAAWGAGADMVEVDIRRTGDGMLVLFHDPEAGPAQERVEDLSWAELRDRAGVAVPRLTDILPGLPEGGRLLLDLKQTEPDFLDQVVAETRGVPADQIWYQSESPGALARIAASREDSRRVLLTAFERGGMGLAVPDPRETAREAVGVGAVAVTGKGRRFIDRAFVAAIQAEGLKFFVWTINPDDRIRHYLELGADGIITDFPDRAVRIRAE